MEPINVFQWWPGRIWEEACPIPSFLIKEAEERNSPYLIFISITVKNSEEIAGWAFGEPEKSPNKELLRATAYKRMITMARERGYKIERVL